MAAKKIALSPEALAYVSKLIELLDDSSADRPALMNRIERLLGLARKASRQQLNPAGVVLEDAPIGRPAGSGPIQSILLGVLQEAGEPLHIAEIWERAKVRGAVSTAIRPTKSVDNTLALIQRSEGTVARTSPGMWKWVGRPADAGGAR